MTGCMAASGPTVRTLVFELGDSCRCHGCRQKTSRVLDRLEGVGEHCYDAEKNQVMVTGTMDPSTVIRKLSKVKKHVRFALDTPLNHQPPPMEPPEVDFNSYPPPPPPPCHHDGLPEYPPPCVHAPPPSPGPPPHSVHGCANELPPSPACHCPPPPHYAQGPPQPPSSSACHCPPPTYPACHCPPPHECNHAPPHSNALSSHAPSMLRHFLHGPDPPLTGPNTCPAELLGQLANIKRLKHIDLINKTGIKLTLEDGHVTSYNPISCTELRPGYDCPTLLPPRQLPPRYVSPFSDENPNVYGRPRKLRV